ncbi:hypothetical protein GCK32_000579 [Trichostrongylus colubriformis]|uniref:Transmembrane protein 135 N-terminal domain-containing protein n=1 Tax=Trichostrongylus colubriformis TaxID=6319 RepID=A0AAN8F2S2_TRICO
MPSVYVQLGKHTLGHQMALLSKLAYKLNLQVLTTNCYETIHTWEPDCYKAILDATPNGLYFSLRTYTIFYLITTLISKRDKLRDVNWARFCIDVIRSTTFLTMNMLLFQFFLCRLRHLLGFFTVPTMGWLSSTLASFFAILIEKGSRRPPLALYTANLASETLFRQLYNHGYLFKVRYGECIPFAIGIGLLMQQHTRGTLPPTFRKLLNFFFCSNPNEEVLNVKLLPDDLHAVLNDLRQNLGRTTRCEHQHSCASVAIESFAKNFTVGMAASILLALMKNLRKIILNPLLFLKVLTLKDNLRIPFFLGLLPFIFHAARCFLNRTTVSRSQKEMNSIVAGVASAASMMVYPNVTIAMYTMWKGIEVVYNSLVERGAISPIPYGDVILYTFSTGYVLWQTVIEPQAIRKGYLNFLDGITGNRIGTFNRDLYEHFGFQSKLLFPNAQPRLNTKYVTVNPMLYQKIMPC